jgi:hypothetical protein
LLTPNFLFIPWEIFFFTISTESKMNFILLNLQKKVETKCSLFSIMI